MVYPNSVQRVFFHVEHKAECWRNKKPKVSHYLVTAGNLSAAVFLMDEQKLSGLDFFIGVNMDHNVLCNLGEWACFDGWYELNHQGNVLADAAD